MSPVFDVQFDSHEEVEYSDSGEDECDPEMMKANHRKSLILLEQNLMVPCDDSPIAPETLKKQEFFSDGSTLEKLMFERLLLRKELRLRTMQEKLLDQESKLEEQEKKISELEAQIVKLTSAPNFINTCLLISGYCRDGFENCCEATRRRAWLLMSVLGQAFCYVLDMIPPWFSLGVAALLHYFGTLIAQRAENFTNERAERAEQESKKPFNSSNNRHIRRRRR